MADLEYKNLDRIRHEIENVPMLPGCYLWKNDEGKVIYVGKAKALRARMRQYVNFSDDRIKIPLLVSEIADFEYVVCESESEALILERNLVNKYKPYYNADLKDDKSYPYIAITGDFYPAIKFTREKRKPGTTYFGPYTNSINARKTVDVVRRLVPMCSANCTTWKQITRLIEKNKTSDEKVIREVINIDKKSCFDSTVGIAPGICTGKTSREEYLTAIEDVKDFLNGKKSKLVNNLYEKMNISAAELNFEQAKRYKEKLDIITSINAKQSITISSPINADVIGIYREETIAGVNVLVVREGSIVNSLEFILDKGRNVPESDLLRSFLLKYIDIVTDVSNEIILRNWSEDNDDLLGIFTKKLNSKHGAKVHAVEAKRGEKFDLLKMSEINAKHTLFQYKFKSGYDDDRCNTALLQLESALALDSPPLRIESYDISTIHGSYTVASMVVFSNGKPDKSQYRRFKIKTPLDEANDFLSMQEVMNRRFSDKNINDKRFGRLPDLVILDGGKPQLTAATKMLDEMGIKNVSLCGLAKRDEEIFVNWQTSGPVVLPSGSASLYLVKQIRDEAHRFAITYHRQLRGKGLTKSVLDDITGLGKVRKAKLIKHFGSWTNLKNATEKDILECGILPDEVLKEVVLVLKQYREMYNKS